MPGGRIKALISDPRVIRLIGAPTDAVPEPLDAASGIFTRSGHCLLRSRINAEAFSGMAAGEAIERIRYRRRIEVAGKPPPKCIKPLRDGALCSDPLGAGPVFGGRAAQRLSRSAYREPPAMTSVVLAPAMLPRPEQRSQPAPASQPA